MFFLIFYYFFTVRDDKWKIKNYTILMKILDQIAANGLQILFPNLCLLCGKELLFESHVRGILCSGCSSGFVSPGEPRCLRCSKPLVSEKELCRLCRDRKFPFESNYSLFRYTGEVKELLYFFKFQGRKRVGYFLALLFHRYLKEHFDADYIIPLPGNPEACRKRGWDHMEWVGRLLKKLYGYPVENCLSRIVSKEQKRLGREKRLENIKDSMIFRSSLSFEDKNILLLDDIFTTGATSSVAAELLLKEKSKKVHVLTFAVD